MTRHRALFNRRYLSPLIRYVLITTVIVAALGLRFTAESKVAWAGGPNLLQNPTFDTNANGWSPSNSLTADWTIFDANGSGSSGSVLVTNTAAGLLNSGATQCVNGLTAGTAYTYGGKIRTSSGQSATGFNNILFSWFAGNNCTGIQTPGIPAPGTTSFDTWTATSVSNAIAPAGTLSAWFYLNVGKSTNGGTYAAYFDSLYLNTVANAAPVITSTVPPTTGTVNSVYSHTYTLTGSAPFTFTLTAGTLPPGILLGSSNGLLSGVPTSVGTYSGTVTVSNGTLPNATQNFSIKITSSVVHTIGIFSLDCYVLSAERQYHWQRRSLSAVGRVYRSAHCWRLERRRDQYRWRIPVQYGAVLFARL